MASPQLENGYIKISNELFEALCRTRISGEARQMLDVIIRKTYGFHKKEDRIATSQFIELTGLSHRAVYKMRRKLKEMNIITISQKGDGQVLTYSVQKNYNTWVLSPKKETLSQKGTRSLPKGHKVSPKRESNPLPKGDTQKIKDIYTKDTIQKIGDFPYLQNNHLSTTYQDFLDMRRERGKPATLKAQKLILTTLHKYDINCAAAMLEQSIVNCWAGVFPLKKGYEDGRTNKKHAQPDTGKYAGISEVAE